MKKNLHEVLMSHDEMMEDESEGSLEHSEADLGGTEGDLLDELLDEEEDYD